MDSAPTRKLGLSLDPAALDALKQQSRNAPEAALRSVARQFEAVFLNMMLKSMRETVPQDGALDSEQSRMFTGMLDEQYASQLTQGRGLGLAEMIVRQLGPSAHPGSPAAGAPAANPAAAVDTPAAATLPATTSSPAASAPGALGSPTSQLANPAPARVAAFRDRMAGAAQAASASSGIPAGFILAQAGLESGWGEHQPLTAQGQPSYNLFGVKAGANWHGAVAHAETTEVIDGVPHRVVQAFRAYGSYDEAFQDYAGLLSGSARYARALSAATPQDFGGALQKAGYATDPAYGDKVTRAIRLVGGLRA